MDFWSELKNWEEFIAYLIVIGLMLTIAIIVRLGLIP